MLKKIKKMLNTHKRRPDLLRNARLSMTWCPECGKESRVNCKACRGEVSPQARETAIANYQRRQAFANSEIAALIGHIEYASPEVRRYLAFALSKALAPEFEAARKTGSSLVWEWD